MNQSKSLRFFSTTISLPNQLLLLFISLMIILSSCSKYNKLVKSTDMNAKYVAAMKYYHKKDYFRALQLLEELISVYRGSAKGEEVYYIYAMSHYQTGDYISAAYHFETFVKTYPNSIYAEEASFLNAYCYYLDSPISSLDQTSSLEAIRQFQIFINRFPQSAKLDTSNALIDELEFKQEKKSYDYAKLYYRMGEYKSAIYAFNYLISQYPATKFKEECLYLMIKSDYLYARQSFEEKKAERFELAIENYAVLMEAFPKTTYKKDADGIKKNCEDELRKIAEKASSISKNN